jgi:hypothetical protein
MSGRVASRDKGGGWWPWGADDLGFKLFVACSPEPSHTVAERTRCEVVSISHRQVVRTASPGRVYLKELLTDFYCSYRSRLHEAADYTHTGMLQQ